MFFLVYASSARETFSNDQLVDLLTRSREKNARLGVTGMLLYKDGNFLQVLEGEEATVRSLYTTIERDPRHHGVLHLLHGTRDERQFPDWSMGFRNLSDPGLRDTPGFSEFLNTPLTGAEFAGDPTRAQRLLLTFKRTM